MRKSALTADLVRFDRHLLAKRAVSCENRKKNQDGSRRPEAAASLRKTPLRKRPAPQEPGDRAGYILHPEKCPEPHSAAPVRQICVSVATMGTRRSWRSTGTRGCSRRSGHARMAGPLIVLQVAVVIPAAGGAGRAKVREAQMRTRVEGVRSTMRTCRPGGVLSRWSPSSP